MVPHNVLTHIIKYLDAGILPRQIKVCYHRDPRRLAAFARDRLHKAPVLSPILSPIVSRIAYHSSREDHIHKPDFGHVLCNAIQCLDWKPAQEPYFIPTVLGQEFDNLNCFSRDALAFTFMLTSRISFPKGVLEINE